MVQRPPGGDVVRGGALRTLADWRWGGGSDYCKNCRGLKAPCATTQRHLCTDVKATPRTAFAKAVVRALGIRSVWRVEPWSRSLSLDLSAAFALLDRVQPGADPETLAHYLSSFEAGAVAGWERTKPKS